MPVNLRIGHRVLPPRRYRPLPVLLRQDRGVAQRCYRKRLRTYLQNLPIEYGKVCKVGA